MTADYPTILATSGGLATGSRTRLELTALSRYAVELAGIIRRAPRAPGHLA